VAQACRQYNRVNKLQLVIAKKYRLRAKYMLRVNAETGAYTNVSVVSVIDKQLNSHKQSLEC
jgi:hypothetical protein